MRYPTPLLEGRLLRRYKRFLADIELSGGEVVTAHCANPGSMKTCAPEGARAWVSRSDNPKRKLPYTWELVHAEGSMVMINTHRANDLVHEAITEGVISELSGFRSLRREVRFGEKSRVDFLLETDEGECYLEVKNVTLGFGGAVSAFPDSVTERGTRHLRELMAMVDGGKRAALLFCCSRAGTESVRPADTIDPTYGRTLREAASRGVELLAYGCEVSRDEVKLSRRLPIDLS